RAVHRSYSADGGRDVFVSEQALVAGVAARLVGQQVRSSVTRARAHYVAVRAVDGDADEVSNTGLTGVRVAGRHLGRLRRGCAENGRDVDVRVLELDVRGRNAAHVASGAGERHPRGRRVLALGCEHVEGRVGARGRGWIVEGCGPVRERHTHARLLAGQVIAERVGDGHSHLVAVDAGQAGQDVGRGVGD